LRRFSKKEVISRNLLENLVAVKKFSAFGLSDATFQFGLELL
jgi:hypothetical protein